MRYKTGCGLLLLLMIGLACRVGQPSKPTVSILAPANDETLTIGQDIIVQSVSVSKVGLKRVELWVNDQLVDTQIADSTTAYTALQPWRPDRKGIYLLKIRAFDQADVVSDPAAVSVVVLPSTSAESPTTSPSAATLTTKTDLNVRAGPSTDFAVLTVLRAGETVTIIGRNAAGTWWLIAQADTPEGVGWASAQPQYGTAVNTAGLPVIEQTEYAPIIHFFQADKVNILPGENVLLQWDLTGAQAAYLYPGGEEGIVAPGQLQVQPDRTTTYHLVAINQQGRIEASLTIEVRP
jgi:hypothetical protein